MCDDSTPVEVQYKTLDCIGRPGYRVGDDGSVWTCRSRVNAGWHKGTRAILTNKWKPMKLTPHPKTRYLVVELGGGDRPRSFLVHRLVLQAFVGPCPEGMEACHAPDPNRSNNRLRNLRWATHVENGQDMINAGNVYRGEKGSAAKITEETARAILEEWNRTQKNKRGIGRAFGVSEHIAGRIIRGTAWKHLRTDSCLAH